MIRHSFSILGHEGVAEAYISKRQDVLQGDKFTFSVADCCSACMMCTRGLNQKCHKLFKVSRVEIMLCYG